MQKLVEHIERAIAADTPPAPLYQRFQHTKQGQVVGLCWYSLEYCWGQRLYPGWHYTVESNFQHEILHESDVQPLEAKG
ncbi:MAG: hypothetical protein AAGA75_24150 [Cyanobacteria bacterium P01_E01_bin.6]